MGHPGRLMWIGGVMLLLGAVMPFLMVISVFPNSLLLSALSYFASIGGLFLGIIGLAGVRGRTEARDRKAEDGTGDMFDFGKGYGAPHHSGPLDPHSLRSHAQAAR